MAFGLGVLLTIRTRASVELNQNCICVSVGGFVNFVQAVNVITKTVNATRRAMSRLIDERSVLKFVGMIYGRWSQCLVKGRSSGRSVTGVENLCGRYAISDIGSHCQKRHEQKTTTRILHLDLLLYPLVQIW